MVELQHLKKISSGIHQKGGFIFQKLKPHFSGDTKNCLKNTWGTNLKFKNIAKASNESYFFIFQKNK